MRGGGKAPKQITWLICLVLYLVALLAHFRVVQIRADVDVVVDHRLRVAAARHPAPRLVTTSGS